MSQLSLFNVSPSPVLLPVDLPAVKNGRPEVCYRHPDQLSMAWTGRGKPPRWVNEWIQSGKSLDALRVPGRPA